MATLKPSGGGANRGPAYGNRLIIYVSNGQLCARSWPRKRGKPKHPKTREQNEWFRQACALAKYASAADQTRARELTVGSPWYPRDLLMSCMAGRAWWIVLEDGRKLYPMAAMRDVSDSLDILGDTRGSILYRSGDFWRTLDPGEEGQVLTAGASGDPSWASGGGGGGGAYSPPSKGDFPTWMNRRGAQVEKSPAGPLVIGQSLPGTGNYLTGRLKTMGASPREYVFGSRIWAETNHGMNFGAIVADSATGKAIQIGVRCNNFESFTALRVYHWSDPDSWDSTVLSTEAGPDQVFFLRIVDDGTDLTFYVSADDAAWVQVYSEPRTDWLTSPAYVGFGFSSFGESPLWMHHACIHYREAGL